jgi:hypothetical protein
MQNKALTVLNESNVDQALITKLLQNLCELLSQNKDLYAIRALLRVIQLSKQNLIPYAETLGSLLATFINEVVKDQSSPSPNYVYILFEASALTLTFVKQDPTAFG